MITFKIRLRKSRGSDEEGFIYYHISNQGKVKSIKTEYRIFLKEWDKEKSQIIIPSTGPRKDYLLEVSKNISNDIRNLGKYVFQLQSNDIIFSTYDIGENCRKVTFKPFTKQLIEELYIAGQIRTSETYKATMNNFMRFRKNKDLQICEINHNLISSYEAWLKDSGLSMNTVSFYMRIMRAIYNRGVKEGLTEQYHPFKQAYTGNVKTVKRSVSLEIIKELISLDLTNCQPKAYARDMFLFSFYTRGMSFIDMAYLKKTDLNNGILSYRRKKTGQLLSIKWEPCMQEIVERYGKKDSPFLLSLIHHPQKDERKQYINEEHRIIRNLKAVGKLVNAPIPLTMYVARHAWASIAKSKNIPISIISESLGHESEMTTRIYLSALDSQLIDEANSLIINSLQK